MPDWQPIETAPRDGTEVWLRAGAYEFRAYAQDLDVEEGYWAWVSAQEDDTPPSWTDGICWSRNEDDEPSTPPTHWRPV